MRIVDWFSDVYQEIEEAERKKKKIDRIVNRAEAMQRFQKKGKWV
jgi:hypothetical protein